MDPNEDPYTHRAWFKLSPELLAKHLHLPDSARIVDVRMQPEEWPPTIAIVVTDPDLPVIEEGAETPEVSPQVQYQRERWDFEWGL